MGRRAGARARGAAGGTDEHAAPPAGDRPEPGRGDTGERIRVAAEQAAQSAEMRSMDEILALEEDLKRARDAAAGEVDRLDERLRDAEARAERAEERARRLANELDEIEARTREAAKRWLRGQVEKVRGEARRRVQAEVERVTATTEARVRSEAEARIRARSEELAGEAERRIAGGDAGSVGPELERASLALAETLARLEDADRRADASETARSAAERALARRPRSGSPPRPRPCGVSSPPPARTPTGASARRRSAPAERPRRTSRKKRGEARARALKEARAEVRRAAEAERRELEERITANAEREIADRVERAEAEAEERIRAEVAVARRAAEERFAEKLAERELELEREREGKVELVRDSDRRLNRIEQQAADAVIRVDAAERRLTEEAGLLQAEAEKRVTAELGEAERRWEVERSDLSAKLEASRRAAEERVDRAAIRAIVASREAEGGETEEWAPGAANETGQGQRQQRRRRGASFRGHVGEPGEAGGPLPRTARPRLGRGAGGRAGLPAEVPRGPGRASPRLIGGCETGYALSAGAQRPPSRCASSGPAAAGSASRGAAPSPSALTVARTDAASASGS